MMPLVIEPVPSPRIQTRNPKNGPALPTAEPPDHANPELRPPMAREREKTVKRDEDYVYLPLVDARKAINVKVNLFAAVVEIGAATRSKGTDYFLKLRIADQSYMAPGISVNFFSENTTKLPQVKTSGDLICLRRVVMKIYTGEVYCAFHKRFSSFALFEGKSSSSYFPYQASQNFHGKEHDEDFIKQLRTWLLDHEYDAGVKDYSLQLREIKVDLECDLVCKVLHVCETSEDVWMLFVWDGTDVPPIAFETNLDAESECASPLHLEASSLPTDILRTFPPVGSILRITAGKCLNEIQQLLGGDHWVKFRQITCGIQSGIWNVVLQNSSKICLLSDEDETVLLRQRTYNERIISDLQRRPLSCFPQPSCITEIDYENVVDATLMDSLTYPEVTHKCKCIVRVVAAHPWQAENLYSSVQGQYRLRLTLEDPTARVHAYICGEDGVKFFGGSPSFDELTRKMNRLLGIAESVGIVEGDCSPRDPPWVQCCLKSYYVDKNDPWQSRKYRIFGTKLVA